MLNTKSLLIACADAEAFIDKHQRDLTAQTKTETNHREKASTTDEEEMVETEKKYCTPTCKYDGGDEEADKMLINCEICKGWYHLSCIELDEKEALELSSGYIDPAKSLNSLARIILRMSPIWETTGERYADVIWYRTNPNDF